MSIIEKLTEGMVQRDLQAEGSALLGKWEKTGLLEGMSSERTKHTMARLLENQAKELLRESNTMAGGDVEGFAAVAFPIVRRVFAGLIANDLVSVQPMSLPSGLIFFLDFKVSDNNGAPRLGYGANDSLYGGGVLGQQITGGVSLTGASAEKGFYNMNNGYSSPTDLRSLQEEAQRSKSNFEKVISCLKTIEYSLGKVIIADLDNPYSFNISVIQKGTDTISVDKKEEEFYDFVSKVRNQLNSTLRSGEYGEAEYTFVEDISNYTISIKFIDNLTRGRFNTAVNNIKTIKTGVRGYHRFSKRVADFQIDLSFPKKSINLSFEGFRTLS
jgi:hypothetical protein